MNELRKLNLGTSTGTVSALTCQRAKLDKKVFFFPKPEHTLNKTKDDVQIKETALVPTASYTRVNKIYWKQQTYFYRA